MYTLQEYSEKLLGQKLSGDVWKVRLLPDRRLGGLGAMLILLDFFIQPLQYWVNLFDVHLR